MSTRNLDFLFRPKSVAVIGASSRPQAIGTLVMRNLLTGSFSGPIMPVNPRHEAVCGVLAYAAIDRLPMVPDLAVICTPPETVTAIMRQLGEAGCRAAIIVTAGLSRVTEADGRNTAEVALAEARRWGIRVLGPNCMGVLVPGIGLNASFAHKPALPGKIAFVSQSGALCTAVLDWARPKGIGFSHFISLGDADDVDFGDVLDYLGSDPSTRAILLYIESIRERRNFMSAARAAARNKPVLAIKAGRVDEGARAAASHTGALAGSDAVFDAALSRAGILRVRDIDELFDGVETLARTRPIRGDRLAILTNGGGIGVMATDDLIEGGGELAKLSPETISKLDAVLPITWSGGNPIDIIGDAPGQRYVAALDVLSTAPEIDAILCMHAPTAVSSSSEVAAAVITLAKERPNLALSTCWVGEEAVAPARRLFAESGIPTYATPASAVRGFLHMVRYRRNQDLLMQIPPSAPGGFAPRRDEARAVIERNLAAGIEVMGEADSKRVLAAYGIPVVQTHVARDPAEAGRIAESMKCAVALKIQSRDISHKSDVGGVVLDLNGAFEVEKAAHAILDRVRQATPQARIEGFTVQEMIRRPRAHELIIGASTDPIFGPVILFGQGGTAVEVLRDRAVALPPLNMVLARELVSRTRIYQLLKGYRDRPAVDIDTLCLSLIQVAQLVTDTAEIAELDINPLFADPQGVLALDARIRIAPAGKKRGEDRLAIRPYPQELEEKAVLSIGESVLIRPIRPEDEPNHHVFLSRLSQEDLRFRFFGLVRELPHSEMARLTQIDYDREMALIAVATLNGGGEETLGVVRTVTDPDNERAEFAIAVRSDVGHRGLGRVLLLKMIEYCRNRGTKEIVGQVLADNSRMMRFVEKLGFERRPSGDPEVVEVVLPLQLAGIRAD